MIALFVLSCLVVFSFLIHPLKSCSFDPVG